MPKARNLAFLKRTVAVCSCLAFVALWETSARSQDATENKPANQQADLASRELQFNFERQPWRGVLDWLAQQADLALHVSDLPIGSFTYSDSRTYTPDEAINRINLFLIPQRYALVRSGKLLSVVNLDDISSVRQLDAMAEMVNPAELQELGSHHLVKCLFALGTVGPEQALEELNGLMLIREPVVLPTTNQLLVTDTAGKLLIVQKVLAGISDPDAAVGPVKMFPLGTLDGERVLAQVRPHVGLDPLAMTGADISLSVDAEGGQLLASGSQDNLDAVTSVIKMLQASEQAPVVRKQLEFRTHDVGQADMQTVVNVLQTLLADEDVRMAPDAKSNQIAILGIAEVHDVITKTITELAGKADKVEFKAISVPVDPRYAVMVLNEMFVPLDPIGEGEAEASQQDAPRISADLFSGRVFVRAKASQISEIEDAVKQLGQVDVAQSSALRMFPYRGDRARQILESAKEFWPHSDDLRLLPSTDATNPLPLEREVNPKPPARAKEIPPAPRTSESPISTHGLTESGGDRATFVNTSFAAQLQQTPPSTDIRPRNAAQIRVQQTPHGILVHSDDPEAIKRFEEHLRLIAGPDESMQRLAVFYLKHATSDEANRLLQRLLDAEESATPFSQALRGGGFPGRIADIVGAGGPDPMWTVGTATIVPDKRLNRLFVYGSVTDLTEIEKHLEVIDRENSIAQVATHGKPRVIQLNYAKAESVAAVIRDAYVGRIAENTQQRQQAAQQNQRSQPASQQTQRQNAEARTPGENQNAARQSGTQSERDTSEQPKLTVAADSQSNSLVITAPDQLAEEVELLARTLDEQGAQSARVFTLTDTSPRNVHETLRRLLDAQRGAGSPSSPQRSTGNDNRSR